MLQHFLVFFTTIFKTTNEKNKEGRVRMLDCKNQSFPAVLNQLPHRVKLNKKAKISEQKKFLAKEAGILG